MQKIKKLIEHIKGFTLIELLVVIAIIGVLTSSVIVATGEARKKSRDVRRLADLKQIANAMELYLDTNNGQFPDSLSSLAPNHIAVVPKDPQTQQDYFYCTNGTGLNDGTTFHLAAAMEKYNPTYFENDADLEADGCTTGGFQGYSESCVEAQKCNGEFCDNCLDFSNIAGLPGDEGGGDNGGGNNGGGDNGGENGEDQCDTLVPNNGGAAQEKGVDWVTRNSAGGNGNWNSIAYGNNLFVAVNVEPGNRVMTSPDGVNWTKRSATGDDGTWLSVTFGNGLFVVVGSGPGEQIMTSPDGINWTNRTAVGVYGDRWKHDLWYSVTYGNGLFVAVAYGGVYSDNRVMTSPDGINWTRRSALNNDDQWRSITYGNGLFVVVGAGHVMTSPNGIDWTERYTGGRNLWAVTYGNGLFVAVTESSGGFSSARVMTSPDGINWTERSAAGDNDSWVSIDYGYGLFVAVSYDGDRVMTSPDGINWTPRSAAGNTGSWRSVTHGNGMFVGIGSSSDTVTTSGKPEYIYKTCP